MSNRTIRVGLLGCGTVGGGVLRLIRHQREAIARRTGIRLEVTRVLVRDPRKPREADPALLTDQPADVLNNGADVVIETIGGVEPAKSLIREALCRGKHVVTANKRLLARHHDELLSLARTHRVRIGYEASACGGVPVIRSLRDALAADRLRAFKGVLNGTSNFILTHMEEEGVTLADALNVAQQRGFTEADPSADLDGTDAAEKTAILCGTAFGATPAVQDIYVRGIASATPFDVAAARRLGRVIRLIACAAMSGHGSIVASVRPTLVWRDSDFARLRDEHNLLKVVGDACGELTFHGRGAGSGPTAAAILSDVLDLATNRALSCVETWRRVEPAEPPPVPWFIRATFHAGAMMPADIQRSFSDESIRLETVSIERDPVRADQVHLLCMTEATTEAKVVRVLSTFRTVADPFIAAVEAPHRTRFPR